MEWSLTIALHVGVNSEKENGNSKTAYSVLMCDTAIGLPWWKQIQSVNLMRQDYKMDTFVGHPLTYLKAAKL